MKIYDRYPLYRDSYLKIGCEAKLLIAENRSDLSECMSMKKPKIIGGLSNILFASEIYDYDFIRLEGEFLKMSAEKDNVVRAGAGVSFASLLSFMKSRSLGGIEELAGIPGTLGGMLFMNAGANGKAISDFVIEYETLDAESNKPEDAQFSYRKSGIKSPVLSLLLRFEKRSPEDAEKMCADIMKKRRETQPLDKPSLGCVFKNPSGKSAWKLVADSGMAGKCRGNVCVSVKHANFIVNEGGGTGADFYSLAEEVKRTVMEKFNVNLEYEIEILL